MPLPWWGLWRGGTFEAQVGGEDDLAGHEVSDEIDERREVRPPADLDHP